MLGGTSRASTALSRGGSVQQAVQQNVIPVYSPWQHDEHTRGKKSPLRSLLPSAHSLLIHPPVYSCCIGSQSLMCTGFTQRHDAVP